MENISLLRINSSKLNNLIYIANAKYNKDKTGRIIDYNIYIKHTKDGELYAESTDGAALLRYYLAPIDTDLKQGESIIINVKKVKKFSGMVHLVRVNNVYMLDDMDNKATVEKVEGVWPNTDNVIPTTKERCNIYVEIRPEYIALKNDIFFRAGVPFCKGLYMPLLWNNENAETTDGQVIYVVMPMRIERM